MIFQEHTTMKNTLLLSVMAVAVLGLSACKEKATVSTTDASGTTTQSTVVQDTKEHANGRVTGTVDTKTTVDPPGMMNKETVKETHEEVK
jgi:hypothetical protein